MQALRRSHDTRAHPFAASTRPDEVTRYSRRPTSCLPLPPCEIRSQGTITLARSNRVSATIRHSLLLPYVVATCYLPCCTMGPFINPKQLLMLDETHRPPDHPETGAYHHQSNDPLEIVGFFVFHYQFPSLSRQTRARAGLCSSSPSAQHTRVTRNRLLS